MDSVTHRITATGPDGTGPEVPYGYADRQRRMLECRHCAWREPITWGGAEDKAPAHLSRAHLSQAHGATGAPATAADPRTRVTTLGTMPACFAVAAVVLLRAVSR
ncbi:hypothetical protein ACFW3D_01695 [Streptomyces sp. NPDC058864]